MNQRKPPYWSAQRAWCEVTEPRIVGNERRGFQIKAQTIYGAVWWCGYLEGPAAPWQSWCTNPDHIVMFKTEQEARIQLAAIVLAL